LLKGLGGMSRRMTRQALWFWLFALLASVQPALSASLELVQTIPLSVNGRIDHLAIDEQGQRLFVAALGNHTLEVIDLAKGKVIRSLGDLGKTQGVAFSASLNRLFVSDGDHGLVQAFDAKTFAKLTKIDGLADADNLRYTAGDERLYVGYGDGAIRVIDANAMKPIADIKLPAHPEGFAVARKDKRIFANVPDAKKLAVIDTDRGELAQSWSTPSVAANFPMALDENARRVFVGARKPPTLLVYDLDTGKQTAALPISGDTDDLFLDNEAGRIYVICGEGYVDVFRKSGADQYQREDHMLTRSGARTGLFSPTLQRLYVAVPRRFGDGAEIRVYATRKQ
jgi:DNA-binding beta-propeller fold protein YncE